MFSELTMSRHSAPSLVVKVLACVAGNRVLSRAGHKFRPGDRPAKLVNAGMVDRVANTGGNKCTNSFQLRSSRALDDSVGPTT